MRQPTGLYPVERRAGAPLEALRSINAITHFTVHMRTWGWLR
ncbi:hypothetical protein [Polaromonas jejuensis]|uniref:Uncharacterized protein n=1 Tax=Polaromonas jejuensis TaxID=457502 RepID=A0ABW0QDQ5_9BURK|nr:hypothetical protein [Polaromonas jejuensis]